jgi:hypothetical protein
MKTLLKPKNLPLLTMISGLLGFFLRLIILGEGPNLIGLYPSHPLEWGLFALVAILLMVFIFLMARPLKAPGTFSENFPASPVSATGCLIGAVGMLVGALPFLYRPETTITSLAGSTGLLAAVALFSVALTRLRGEKPFFLSHIAVCLHMVLRIFETSRQWSNETQYGLFLIPFLAVVSILLAAYYLSTFDVELCMRRHSVFWSLTAVHLCITTLADTAHPDLMHWTQLVFFGSCAIWLLTNLCCLHPLKPQAENPEEPEPEPDMTAVEAFLREPDTE